MKRVTGLGGIFFKSKDTKETYNWYKKHLGINAGDYGATFKWSHRGTDSKSSTAWSTFKDDTTYFDPSKQDHMINYRVENLKDLLNVLKEEGVQMAGEMQSFDYGHFAWILDNEGRKIELWEPIEEEHEKLIQDENETA